MAALPVIDLDRLFWLPGLAPCPGERWTPAPARADPARRLDHQRRAWARTTRSKFAGRAADTAIVLDLSLARCAYLHCGDRASASIPGRGGRAIEAKPSPRPNSNRHPRPNGTAARPATLRTSSASSTMSSRSCESRRKNDGTAGPGTCGRLPRCHRAGARASQPRRPFWNASNSIQTLEPITAFAIEQVSRGLIDRHLVFATCGSRHAVGPDVVVTVGRHAPALVLARARAPGAASRSGAPL